MPSAPAGYDACRVIGRDSLTTHLVQLDEAGSNGGRPTACGLTRFGDDADLPGWGMGDSGVTGPGVEQIKCAKCYAAAEPRGLSCYIPEYAPGVPGLVLVCEDCDTKHAHVSHEAAALGWTLHVLQEHWEQAGFSAEERDEKLHALGKALR